MLDTPMTIQVSVEGPSRLTEETMLCVKTSMALEIANILAPEIRIKKAEEIERGLAKYTTILQCDFI